MIAENEVLKTYNVHSLLGFEGKFFDLQLVHIRIPQKKKDNPPAFASSPMNIPYYLKWKTMYGAISFFMFKMI